MNVLFASAECAPFFKTGGLGDVAASLPKALAKKATDISVVLPYFTKMPEMYQSKCQTLCNFTVEVGWRKQSCEVKQLKQSGVTYYFIENAYYFDRENLYGYDDDGERFAFFSLAIIEMINKLELQPEIIHVNDFHTAMIPFLLKEKYASIENFQSIRTILTIHNIEFQGNFAKESLSDYFGIPSEPYMDRKELFSDGLNYLKTGILFADHVTTVSPTYAKEIQTQEFAFGLDRILSYRKNKLTGILNGIDYELNNPETDQAIPAPYSVDNLADKKKNKQVLQEKMNLPVRDEIPLIGIVSRLTAQKGFLLVLDELAEILDKDVQLVLLGTGDKEIERSFQQFAERYPNKFKANITFDVDLAQLIYAGADLFLMPSKSEPCGLSQMLAMHYGTLPIVHEVGGLKDTVIPFNPIAKSGTGFGFAQFDTADLIKSIQAAIDLYWQNQEVWQILMKNAMEKDFSWEKSSRLYLDLYQKAISS